MKYKHSKRCFIVRLENVWSLPASPVIDGSRNEIEPHVLEGQPITLWCPATGNPLPRIRWLRNGTEITSYHKENMHKYRILDQGQGIEIAHASAEEDHALWRCEAENSAGNSQMELRLDVWSEPAANVKSEDGSTAKVLTSPLTLICVVTGNPRPMVRA